MSAWAVPPEEAWQALLQTRQNQRDLEAAGRVTSPPNLNPTGVEIGAEITRQRNVPNIPGVPNVAPPVDSYAGFSPAAHFAGLMAEMKERERWGDQKSADMMGRFAGWQAAKEVEQTGARIVPATPTPSAWGGTPVARTLPKYGAADGGSGGVSMPVVGSDPSGGLGQDPGADTTGLGIQAIRNAANTHGRFPGGPSSFSDEYNAIVHTLAMAQSGQLHLSAPETTALQRRAQVLAPLAHHFG